MEDFPDDKEELLQKILSSFGTSQEQEILDILYRHPYFSHYPHSLHSRVFQLTTKTTTEVCAL
ncbi:hypothetical protein CJF32_00001882 [Rutstroemia sp. NJR-2017a WRK4]|nr:hypothetical protein CJF32_00001882 [Rutstroemia sp. NJR-2017a WRK4]